jgi:hypothetical protein
VFRSKCPFCVFIISKLRKYGINLWVAADAKYFYVHNMQVYTGKTVRVREKKQGLRIVKGMVCHIYETEMHVITANFFISCEQQISFWLRIWHWLAQ